MNTNGILALVFGVLACIFLVITILTSHTETTVDVLIVENGATWTQVNTTNTINVTTWHNETQIVTRNRTVENRNMEEIKDLPGHEQKQWGESPGAFQSTWTTTVNLTYSPVMNNEPLTGRGKYSGAPKTVLRLTDNE